MSEWLLSERQSICVWRDRMSAPMPCVLLTQRYGFFIRSNQWYMKQHIHISNNRSFLVLAMPTFGVSSGNGSDFLNQIIPFFWEGGGFFFRCLVWGEIQYRWKTSNKQHTQVGTDKWKHFTLVALDVMPSTVAKQRKIAELLALKQHLHSVRNIV